MFTVECPTNSLDLESFQLMLRKLFPDGKSDDFAWLLFRVRAAVLLRRRLRGALCWLCAHLLCARSVRRRWTLKGLSG